MAKFYGGQGHLSVHVCPSLGHTFTGDCNSGQNLDITDDAHTVDCFSSDASGEIDPGIRSDSNSSDDMKIATYVLSDSASDLDMGNHVDVENSNDTCTENHKRLDIVNDACAVNRVDSEIKKSDATLDLNELNLDSKKSSTAFTIDFGSVSSSGTLSISDNLSQYLPRHVAQRVERRASNVKVKSDRGKALNKEGSSLRSEKSLPGFEVHHRPTSGTPDKRKSLPIVNIRHVEPTPCQQTPGAAKKPTSEGKRASVSSTLHNASSFRMPCRKFSCPLNQSSSRSANNFRLASPRSTDLNLSDLTDCVDSKSGAKCDRRGMVRSNHSYTILDSASKCGQASDTISDSGTYELDEEQRDDILKARRTISHVFGVRVSPNHVGGSTGKPKRLVTFTRSSQRKQSPARKATTGSLMVGSCVRRGPSSADANKSKSRCPVKGKSAQFGESEASNLGETLQRNSSSSQSKRNSKATTRVLEMQRAANGVLAAKETRPDSRSSSIDQPFKSGFGVSSSDHVVNSSSSKVAATSCPTVLRPIQPVTLRTNRTFELRCARLEASTAVGSNADGMSLLAKKKQHPVPKLSVDGSQGTSSHTSICSRESGNSSIRNYRDIACARRGSKQSSRQSCCSLLQEEVLSPVESLASVTVDGSHTSLYTTHGKKPHVRKTSSLLTYQRPRGREKALAGSSSKGLTPQDRFALNLPEVKAWHERHQNDRARAEPGKVPPGNWKSGQMTSKLAKNADIVANLLGNNIITDICRNSFSISQAKNGNKLNALKMLLRMSEEITADLRKINENRVCGVTLPLSQQQTVTNAMVSAFKNCLQMEKDIKEIRKVF